MGYFEKLPKGYTKTYEITAENPKVGMLVNIASIFCIGMIMIPCYFGKGYELQKEDVFSFGSIMLILGFVLVIFAYVYLHELVHGLFYKLFTKKKLTFETRVFVSRCSVPDIFIHRWTKIAILMAPFFLFGIPLFLAVIFVPGGLLNVLLSFFLAVHVGGCVMDFFLSIKLLSLGKTVVCKDNGIKQSFYIEVKE